MRRGFKAACERIATEQRQAIELRPEDALDPETLAQHLGVTVWRPEDVPDLSPDSLARLVTEDADAWSAVTMQVRSSRVTIVNSAHAPTRRRSSLAHELAHLILGHRPSRIDVSAQGLLVLSTYDGDEEDEATWLAGALLVPREGLMQAYRWRRDEGLLAERFGVSLALLRWRLRMTGVALQSRRASAYRQRIEPHGRSAV